MCIVVAVVGVESWGCWLRLWSTSSSGSDVVVHFEVESVELIRCGTPCFPERTPQCKLRPHIFSTEVFQAQDQHQITRNFGNSAK